ncbi:MAG: FliM/FliN family flagellar motor C-terminal domain-containing protein, partial [Hyphomicrobium sp.]
TISLNEVRQFAAGKTIALNCESLTTLRLDVEERPSFWCELGKSGDDLCLRIDRSFDPDEFANDEI